MRKIDRLKKEAMEAFLFRGHVPGKWLYSDSNRCASNICVRCRKGVYVDVNPAPNGIDISGEAVALSCSDK